MGVLAPALAAGPGSGLMSRVQDLQGIAGSGCEGAILCCIIKFQICRVPVQAAFDLSQPTTLASFAYRKPALTGTLPVGTPVLQPSKRYSDRSALERVVASLSRLPPLVVSWEIEALRAKLAQAQRGEQFLLQGGDCAESFEDCESDNIARRLKILLQMSLVLLQGLKKPIVRVGRFAGQYAKPRSADTETRHGVTLPTYRGDNVNRPGFTAAEREPDPELLLRGYERASLTLNFVRALIDGKFADLHHQHWT